MANVNNQGSLETLRDITLRGCGGHNIKYGDLVVALARWPGDPPDSMRTAKFLIHLSQTQAGDVKMLGHDGSIWTWGAYGVMTFVLQTLDGQEQEGVESIREGIRCGEVDLRSAHVDTEW